jgi:hypothetical protein
MQEDAKPRRKTKTIRCGGAKRKISQNLGRKVRANINLEEVEEGSLEESPDS